MLAGTFSFNQTKCHMSDKKCSLPTALKFDVIFTGRSELLYFMPVVPNNSDERYVGELELEKKL